jgi:2'-5' RNA ligase
MGRELNEPRQIYEWLWTGAVAAFEKNHFALDPHLPDKRRDDRRGVALAFKPSRTLQNSIALWLQELAAVAPGQYFYPPEELHVTVLAIIPGSESWRQSIPHLASCKILIGDVLSRHRKFSITFRGVTASPGSVMIQGFPADDTLRKIREDLRETLRQNHLGDGLDVRYKIKSAHITAMRFCQSPANSQRLAAWLKAHRTTPFGDVEVAGLELLFGDWYASAKTARVLQKYPLKAVD